MKKTLLLIILILCTFACDSKNFEKNIGKDYYLKRVDLNGLQFIGKLHDTILEDGIFEIIISDYVFAIGSNENIIIAKQHPSRFQSYWNIDTAKTLYYVIDLKDSIDNVYGTSYEYEFENKVLDLNGEMIEFDLLYPELKK